MGLGIGVAIAADIVGIAGLVLVSAGIYYVAADWGSAKGSDKARAYSLLIAGIIVLALAIIGLSYYLFRPGTQAGIRYAGMMKNK
jgi:hypothetical protein